MDQKLQLIISQLKPYDPQKIILFGSRAKGTANEESDWDIAIVKDTDKPFTDRIVEASRMVDTDEAIDFFVFTQNEIEKYKDINLVVNAIATQGKIVYEKE